MDDDKDRELRQLRLMEDRLRAFARGELAIGPTIADLEGLLWALQQTPEAWRDQFREEWGELEIAYAVALDRGLPVPDATDPTIRGSVDAMIVLIQVATDA